MGIFPPYNQNGAGYAGASETSVDYRFAIDNGDGIYRLNTEVDANPFTSLLLRTLN